MLILASLVKSCSKILIMSPRTCLALSSSPSPSDCGTDTGSNRLQTATKMLEGSIALNRGV